MEESLMLIGRGLVLLVASLVQFDTVPIRPQHCRALPAHVEGTLEFRGDRWHLGLHTQRGKTGEAQLDIPDLLLAGRPASLRCEGGSWQLELPFGFGVIALERDTAGTYRGGRLLAGDSMRLELAAGRAPPYTTEEVHFRNGGVELRGTLYLPATGGPHPAVVMVHGSGAQGRQQLEYRSWGDFHARRGIAALIYDKRGVGESGGDFRTDSAFVGVTGDALAAVAYLVTRPEIRAGGIGLSGASQAGWIAYRAARHASVAWVALLVPPTVSVAEQEIQRVRAQLRSEGFGSAAVDAAVTHTRLLLSVAVSGMGWEALQESTHRVARESWSEWVHRPDSLEDLRWWRDHALVDPSADLDALRVPLFAAFSAEDPVVPARYNAGPLRELQAARPGHDVTVLTVERGDHRLEVAAGRDAHGRWHLPRVSREVMDGLAAWLQWRLAR
jgi:alpha/beta superfamily hydrolase